MGNIPLKRWKMDTITLQFSLALLLVLPRYALLTTIEGGVTSYKIKDCCFGHNLGYRRGFETGQFVLSWLRRDWVTLGFDVEDHFCKVSQTQSSLIFGDGEMGCNFTVEISSSSGFGHGEGRGRTKDKKIPQVTVE